MSLLRLAGWQTTDVAENHKAYRITARPTVEPEACPCGSRRLYGHGTVASLFRDLPIHGKRVALRAVRKRYRCRDCRRTFLQPVPGIHEGRKLTSRLVDYVGKQAEGRTFVEVGKEVGLDEKTVRSIFEDHADLLASLAQPETPRVLGIDEVHIRRRARCVFTNIEAGTIVEILPGWSYRTVRQFLLTGLKDRHAVQLVCVDMHRPYLMAARDAMPTAMVIVDKFHVVRMATTAVDKVRLHLRSSMTDRKRRELMRSRFLLLKRRHTLQPFERVSLEAWLDQLPLLREAYTRKEAFFDIYDAVDRGTAEQLYHAWKHSLPRDLVRFYQPLLTAMENWHDPIFAYFDHRYTNAATEALNGLIKIMNRQGRGYRFRTLRAKMLFTKGVRPYSVAAEPLPRYGWGDDMLADGQPLNLGASISTLHSFVERGRI